MGGISWGTSGNSRSGTHGYVQQRGEERRLKSRYLTRVKRVSDLRHRMGSGKCTKRKTDRIRKRLCKERFPLDSGMYRLNPKGRYTRVPWDMKGIERLMK